MIPLLLLLSPLALAAAGPEQVVVYRETGRFGGWPANHGIWSWGNEILVGFSAAWYKPRDPGRHQMDGDKPEEPRLARSFDGGRTWTVEAPPSLLPPAQGGRKPVPLSQPIPFTAPGFAMTIRFLNIHQGASLLYWSQDRGKTWRGPFEFPTFGQQGVAARTDYVIDGPQTATVFLTASKSNGKEGRPFACRTTDGGLTWQMLGWIGPEPSGFAIMPSSLRLGPKELLTTVRVKLDLDHNWIDAWRSTDNGRTWKAEGKVGYTGGFSGTPPHLIRLRDGRLCLTYASRNAPYPILARLSSDQGRTWSPPQTLRADAIAWDMGYVRSAQRPDGKVVTVYYYNDSRQPERFIAATLWQP
ncbi:MAG: exo-alpha-sialidase [Bryobacterales bacterium]|nr:exo-alpha-sialidase [Bryobacterales bacterium]